MQSNFCRAYRPARAAPPPAFAVVAGSVQLTDEIASAQLFSAEANSTITLLLRAAADDTSAPSWRFQLLQHHASNDFAISRLVLPPTSAGAAAAAGCSASAARHAGSAC